MLWMKQHIHVGHPVIFALFDRYESDPDYDHIVLGVNALSTNWSSYQDQDVLYFNDGYEPYALSRRFSTFYDTRSMKHNCAKNEYCVPQNVDYGCAVTGIRDDSGTALPVRLTLNRWTEPDLIKGERPVTLKAVVTVTSLVKGKTYALLRYDNYRNVPTKNFLSSAYTVSLSFVAAGNTFTYNDQFSSNGIVVYRCVPAGR
jgi:hypothetical protein